MAHVVEVIVVLVLGLLPGIIVLSTTKYQIDRFPPDTCYPNIEIMFHSFILPVIIYATIELAMLFTVFSVLRQVSEKCSYSMLKFFNYKVNQNSYFSSILKAGVAS